MTATLSGVVMPRWLGEPLRDASGGAALLLKNVVARDAAIETDALHLIPLA